MLLIVLSVNVVKPLKNYGPTLGNNLLSKHKSMISLISFSECSASTSYVPSTVLEVYVVVGNANMGLKH